MSSSRSRGLLACSLVALAGCTIVLDPSHRVGDPDAAAHDAGDASLADAALDAPVIVRDDGGRDATGTELDAGLDDASTADDAAVSPDAPIDEVVKEMADKKFGSAVVVDNGKVVGMFTATDALSAFAELLQTRLKH